MRRGLPGWLGLWCCLAGTAAGAQDLPSHRAAARDPTWLRLLHMPADGGPSQVLSTDFFLAPDGARDAGAELEATLQAWQQPWGAQPDQDPRCRFPARYRWLADQGLLTGAVRHEPRCQALNQWARWDELDSLSLMLVSGYLGNPASTFGHALLRLNTRTGAAVGGQTDVSVSFGADVPPNEWMLSYIVRGLSGGYLATYSDKPFYANDLVYAHTEFRDVWDYTLQLTPAQRELLVMHLWEVMGRQFDYYFLSRNCALRLAELVELATGRPVVGSSRLWYAPVELFDALHRLDAQGPALLAGAPGYRPSAERVLLSRFAALDEPARQVARRLIDDDLQGLDAGLASLSPERQLDVLDVLLAWHEYRLAGSKGAPDPGMRNRKDRVLRARLVRPMRSGVAVPLASRPSPALGHGPGLWSLGWAQTAGREGGVFKGAAFSYEQGGFHGLEQGELVALEGTVSTWRNPRSGRLPGQVERLDLIRVRRMALATEAVAGLAPLSWQMRLGWQRGTGMLSDQPLRAAAEAGVGRADRWGTVSAWLFLQGRWREGESACPWGPQLGWEARGHDWTLSASHGLERSPGVAPGRSRAWYGVHRLGLTGRLARESAIRLELQSEAGGLGGSLSWQYFH